MKDVYLRTGEMINQQRAAFVEAIVARQYAAQADVWQSYGARGRDISLRDANYHLSYLSEAISAADPALFTAYVAWAKSLFAGLNLPDYMLAGTLEFMRDALANALPAEQQRVVEEYLAAGLDELDRAPAVPPAFLQPGASLAGLAGQYLEALLRTDRQAARVLILDELKRRTSVEDIYLHVFQPSQYEIGRLWQIGQVSVAQEHYCTAATQWVIAQLYPHIAKQRARQNGRRILIFCVSGELHELGSRMVADFFELSGWQTDYLGANLPANGLAQILGSRRLDAVAISATMTFHLPAVRDLIAVLRATPAGAGIPVLVGGYPFNIASRLWSRVGADAGALDAQAAVAAANELATGKLSARPVRHRHAGAAWLVDEAGQIQEVLRDDLGWLKQGDVLPQASELDNAARALDFLAALQERSQVIEWTLPVILEGSVKNLHCAGVSAGSQLLVVVSQSSFGARQICQELAAGDRPWSAPLLAMLVEWAELTDRQGQRSLHDQLARLTNDLGDLQRELAKRYADFEPLAEGQEPFDRETTG
jgi:MerR family transcriptional regulator, light-induced transcriptional regulator